MGSACFPRSSRPTDPSLPSTGSLRARSPASTVLSRRYDFLPAIPPHFVAFAGRYLRVHSFSSLPGGRVHRRGPELLTRSPGRELAEEATGSRKFLGNPDCPFAHVQSTPAGLRSPDHCGGAAWPLGSQKQRLPRGVFRRSIAWLSDWLSPLRRAGYPRPAPDSLPAAGQALPDGLSTRRVPLKGFRGRFPTSHPPFPDFLPQCDRPKRRMVALRASVGSTEARNATLGS